MADLISRIAARYNAGLISASEAYHAICALHLYLKG